MDLCGVGYSGHLHRPEQNLMPQTGEFYFGALEEFSSEGFR